MSDMVPTWVGGDLVAVDTLDVHRQGLRHRAVSVFLIHEGLLLLQRRSQNKAHTPGLWSSTCCSHPHWGEQPLACAIRHLRGELGITATLPLTTRPPIEYRADVGSGMTDHEVVDVFVADTSEKPGIVPNPDEVSQVTWLSLPALVDAIAKAPGDFTPWLRTCMSENRHTIFG